MSLSRLSLLLAGAAALGLPLAVSAQQQTKQQPPAKQQAQTGQQAQPQRPQGKAQQPQGKGQQTRARPRDRFAGIPPARPADVASPEAIVSALYNVISGDAGVQRDWNRFRSLFYPGARLIPMGRNLANGRIGANLATPADYIRVSGPVLLRDGFHEVEVSRRIERFGPMAHVFSTYASRRKVSDPQPFMRGINSIQLLNDGSRWWVVNVMWVPETPQNRIPPQYLGQGGNRRN